jgi:hypothetical protein
MILLLPAVDVKRVGITQTHAVLSNTTMEGVEEGNQVG